MGFKIEFENLIGFKPMKWQARLYSEYLKSGDIPGAIDVPTGLGKTSVMAIWYLALRAGARLPRRLVYVVDRRAVVDQATTVADEIKKKSGDEQLRVSTLRGQHADNGEWLENPASPAIIVGTVDMIGSRILFSGYGVSRKMRPYHAGLLGADTLIVLDESHLVPPFERLLEAIGTGTGFLGTHDKADRGIVPPFKLLSLSATGRVRKDNKVKSFRLDEKKGDLDDEVVKTRLEAKKHLTIESANGNKLEAVLADQAWMLSGEGKQAVRIIIYCNSRKTAENTKKAIKAKAKSDKKKARPKVDIETELSVGARRVKERVDAAGRLETLGFLGDGEVTFDKPAFLIATSAGEVGVDLDADHMVCDLVAWERMVQRFGRVNRRGKGDSRIILTIGLEPTPTKKEQEALDKKKNGQKLEKKDRKLIATAEEKVRTWRSLKEPFNYLPTNNSEIDVSSGALRKLKLRAKTEPELQKKIEAATTPPPLYPALTRALVDAWSMTSLKEHTGRPEVAPWLRGWVEDDAQTAVVWRKYLPVRTTGEQASKKDVEDFFEAAPPYLSEKLETETWRVGRWLTSRAKALSKAEQMDSGTIIAFALEPDGSLRENFFLRDFIKVDDKERKDWIKKALTGATLIIDARLGGLKDGLLAPNVDNEGIRTADDGGEWPSDVGFRIRTASDEGASDGDFLITHTFVTKQFSEGEDIERLLIETKENEDGRATLIHPQLLDDHLSWTEVCARKIAEAAGLTGLYIEVVAIAARLHDAGKKAVRWQRAFNARKDGIYAKTRGPLNLPRLGGYRHEFGSLPDAERDEAFKGLPSDLQELVLHLIAAHHGRARPVIGTEGCDDAPPSLLKPRARDVALRFARLQKRWGPWGLAWWESLLRAADQQSSRNNSNKGHPNGGS